MNKKITFEGNMYEYEINKELTEINIEDNEHTAKLDHKGKCNLFIAILKKERGKE